MSFIVIEGLDGSGKSTQLKLLLDYLRERQVRFQYMHFPRTGSPVFGDLIARFLRGDLGALEGVNPYLVALIYAGDRHDASGKIRQWLQEGQLVVVDRYVYSNIAFQCAKLDDPQDQKQLWEWILHLEYQYYAIPMPELNIFLDVPFGFTRTQLGTNREGDDRSYLDGRKDIHEEDLELQKKVRKIYHRIAGDSEDLKVIECGNGRGSVLPADVIFDRIRDHIEMFI